MDLKNEKKEHDKTSVSHVKKKGTFIGSRKYFIWASAIQVVLLVFIAFQLSNLSLSDSAPAVEVVDDSGDSIPSAQGTGDSFGDSMVDLADDDAYKGDVDAPVTIVEFSDFECPFCTRFYTQTLPQIEEQYIDTGKVKFVYRDFPLGFHSNAQKAAEAAECAGDQDQYWEMHDLLFDKGVSGGVSSFKQYASDLGLDTDDFDDCLDSNKYESEVKKDLADGSAAGVSGTPGFIVNGKLISGAQPFSVFQQAIESALN